MEFRKLDDLETLALARNPGARAAVVAAHEEHILEAVVRAKKAGLITPVLIGDREKIADILRGLGENADAYEITDSEGDEASVAAAMQLVKNGGARLLIKGLIETADLMRQMLNKETGILQNGCTVSAVALVESPKYHKLFAMTDLGVNMFPDVDRKAQIINNAVSLMRRAGIENPKVAVLSSVANVNPKQPDTVEAAQLRQMNLDGDITGCVVEGPIALDLAISREAAEIKGYDSPVAGDADILMFPNILTGNMIIKAMGYFGEIRTADVILGCEVPIVFGSRGGPIEGKYRSIALCALIAGRDA